MTPLYSVPDNSLATIIPTHTEQVHHNLIELLIKIPASPPLPHPIKEQMQLINGPLEGIIGLILRPKDQHTHHEQNHCPHTQVQRHNISQH